MNQSIQYFRRQFRILGCLSFLLLLVCSTQTLAQGFASVTNLTALPVSASTGEKPQSKVWKYDGEWWAVMPDAGGTKLWHLVGGTWTSVLTLSANTDTHADCKVSGDVVHILLYRGTSSELVSVEYVPGMTTYQLWSVRPGTVTMTLDAGVETANIDIDGTGRMWLASAGTSDINVRWSDAPYSSWSAAIALATGVTDDDICALTYLPGKIGVLWSDQNAQRFGFKTHTDGDAATTWSANEVPASQSALNIGLGMADDHLNMAVAADGTLYCAVKTSYDTPGYPKLAMLIRRPAGTWDDLYPVSETGTRPIVLLNEAAGKVKIIYSAMEGGGNILYKETLTSPISLSAPLTLITGAYNDVTSTKQNYNPEVVVLASNGTDAVGVSAVDNPNPLVCHLKMDEGSGMNLVDASTYGNNGVTVGSPTWTTGVIGQALSLNGTTQYGTVADANSLDVSNAITLAAWIKPTVQGTQRIIVKVDATTGFELFLENPAPSRVSVRLNGSAGPRVNSTSSYLNYLNTWIHVAATYDGTTIRLYFNGVEEGSLATNIAIGANTMPVGIGASEVGANPFNGLIDDARIYNVALNSTQIMELASVMPGSPSLVSPANGASAGIPPALSWSPVLGASSYRLQVSTMADFSSNLFDQGGLVGTSQPITGLLQNTLYYWRVNATNPSGTSDWSSVWNFTAVMSGDYALDLNGSTNYVNCGNDASLHLSNFTLEAWVKIEGTGTATSTGGGGITDIVPIISKGRAEAESALVDVNFFLGYQLSTNKLAADFEDNINSGNHPVIGNATLGTCWTHVAATYDVSGVWKLYINGALDQTLNLGGSFTPQFLSNVNACIGSSLNSTNLAAGFFNGLIDEARVWNVVRTEAEIAADYDAELNSGIGLSARYGFNSGAGSVAENAVGPYGAIAGTAVWVPGFEPFGGSANSLDFNGSSDVVSFGAAPVLNTTTFTLEAWIKIEGAGVTTSTSGAGGGGFEGATAAVPLVTKGRGEGDTPDNLNMNYFMGLVGNKLAADFEEAAGLNHSVIGNATIPSNTWTHVAATYEPVSAVWNLYINGVLDKTLDLGSNVVPVGVSIQHAGVGSALTSTGVAAGFFNGLIDEVRIWNVARTASEILDNYPVELTSGPGLIGRWGFNDGCGLTAVNSVAASPNGTLSSITGPLWSSDVHAPPGPPNAPTLVSPADLATGIGIPPTLTWNAAAGATSYQLQLSLVSDFSSTENDISGITTTAQSVVGLFENTQYYWRVNATNVAGTSDWSNVWSFTTAASGAFALDFNGTNNYINAGNDAALHVTNFTLEAWIKIEGTGTSTNTGSGGIADVVPIISRGRAEAESEAVDVNFFLGYQLSTNKLVADFEDNAGSVNHPVIGNATLGSCWTHVAATYDVSGVWKLYINGVLDQTLNLGGSFTPQSLSTINACIGSSLNSANLAEGFFNGVIDEVRVWNVVRTGTEIATDYDDELYGGTGLAARYGLNSGAGAVAVNSVGPPGTISGTPVWVGGFAPFGGAATSLDFNGTSDYVTFGTATPLNTTKFTLEAWIKIEGAGTTTSTGTGGLEGANLAVPLVTKGRGEGESPANLNMNYFMGLVGNKLAADFEEAAGPNHPVIGNTVIPSNVWTHVAATYEPVAGVWNLYINGVLDKTLSVGANITPVGTSIQHAGVGSAMTSTGVAAGFFNGVIDEVRIWNVVRSQSEILDNLNLEITSGPGLIGRWGFNEGCGLTAGNAISGSPNGTLSSVNGPIWRFDSPITGMNNLAPDQPANPSPADNATSVSTNPNLCVDVMDPDGDNLRVRYYGRPKTVTGDPFTIIWLPDTQYYVEEPPAHGGTPSMFNAQTTWAVNNEVAENIVFVGQLGDCVEHGDYLSNPPLGVLEWNRAKTAMYALEPPEIPYGVCAGNHDQSPTGDPNGTTAGYNEAFGVSHFTGAPYYGGHFGANNDNHYELFSASGIDFMVIAFEYDQSAAFAAPGGALEWATNLIANTNRKVIVMSHFVLSDNGNFSTQGQYIYDAFKIYSNFVLMVGGHDPGGDGEARRTDVFGGNTVHTVLADYQGRANGGNGLMRIFKFEPASNNISVKTYSPFTNTYEQDGSSEFNLPMEMGGGAPFTLIGELNNVPSGTRPCMNWPGRNGCTGYEWYVELFDGNATTTGPVWDFTTVSSATATITPDGPTTFCTGGTVTLTASAGVSYLWSTSETTQSIVVSTGGTYTVAVTDANSCTATDEETVVVNALPTANAGANVAICAGTSTSLSGSGGVSCAWSPALGLDNAAICEPVATPSGTTVYTLTVTDANGCMDDASVTVTVNALPTANAGANVAICAGASTSLSGSGGVSCAWSPALGLDNAAICEPVATPSGTTVYTLTVTDANGCMDDASVTVTVNALPTANAGANVAICAGASTSLSGSGGVSCAWSPALGLDNAAICEPVATPSGTTVYTLTVTDANGCMDDASVTVTVNALPTANAGANVAICAGTSTSLSGSGGVSCAWSPALGLDNAAICEPVATPSGTTVYTLTVTDANGCMDDATVTVTVNALPTANAGANVAICAGTSTSLSGSGGVSCAWSPALGLDNAAICDPVATPSGTTEYTLTVTDANGCMDDATVTVTVNALPTADAGADVEICTGGSTSLSGSGGVSCAWSPALGLDNAAICDPVATPSGTTEYTLTVTDANGCMDDATVTVTVSGCGSSITGKLIWEGNRLTTMSGVNNAVVTLGGDDDDTWTTGVSLPLLPDGAYQLTGATGSNYTVTPLKNRPLPGAISGLSSADAARIQQHVFGVLLLTDPYKLIAADANKSGPTMSCTIPAITTADASWVQQAVLGNPVVRDWFAMNTWRFVPKDYPFPNPLNPWSSCTAPYFPESITLTGSATNQDFIGIKVGDVNSTANPLSAPGGWAPDLVWKVQDQVLEQGATVTATFHAQNFNDLLALQFGLQFDPGKIQFEGIGTMAGSPLQAGNFGLYDLDAGAIRAFLAMPHSKTLPDGLAAGFSLTFKVLQGGGKLSDVLQLSNAVLQGEAYRSDYTPGPVSLVYEGLATGTIDLADADFALFQNQPNPFKAETTIGFILPEACEAEIRVIDVNGRLVEAQKGWCAKGFNQWNFRLAEHSGDGVLYYELVTPYGTLSKKMVLVRD